MTQATKIRDSFTARRVSHNQQIWGGASLRRLQGDEEERIRDELGKVRTDRNLSASARVAHAARARHLQLLFDFAIETFTRLGELTSLQWRHIDQTRRIMSPPSKPRLLHGRKVYLTARALEILQELWQDENPAEDRVFHRLAGANAVGKAFRRAVDSLGIDDLAFHDLKAEGICRHLEKGLVAPKVLMRMAGYAWSPALAKRYQIPSDEEIFARMESTILNQFLPAPAATTRLPESLTDASAPNFGADPALIPAPLAAPPSERLGSTRKQPLRL